MVKDVLRQRLDKNRLILLVRYFIYKSFLV